MIHYPEPKRSIAFGVERMIIAGTVVLTLLAGGMSAMLCPQFWVPSVLPIVIMACFLTPRIVLALFSYRDAFDPWTLTCCMGFIIFVVTPLLHLYYDVAGLKVLPTHFEPLLRVVMWSSLPIIPLMYLGHRIAFRYIKPVLRPYHRANVTRLIFGGMVLSVVGTVAFILFYTVYGGHSGREVSTTTFIVLTKGTLLVLADGGILGVLIIMYSLMLRNLGIKKKLRFLDSILIGVVCLLAIVANLYRGSRAKMLIVFFWSACLYNQFVKRLSLLLIILAIAIMMPMLTIYKVSKLSGFADFGELLTNPTYRQRQFEAFKKSPVNTLMGSLGRSYVWMLYYQELRPGGNIDKQWGKTYATAFLQIIPRWLYPSKPASMTDVTVDARYGRGRARRGYQAAMVGGIWAEGYVNFGFAGIWAAAFVYGLISGYAKRFFARRDPANIFHFLFYLAANLGIMFLIADFLLIVWNFFRIFILLVPILWWASDLVEPELEDLYSEQYSEDGCHELSCYG